jgi:predicted ATPase
VALAIPRVRDGSYVYFVDPSPISDHRLLPAAAAQVLQLREQPGRQPLEALIDHLRGRQMMLVLDNFEHLLEGAETVGLLLDAAPRLTVLATSRIPLYIWSAAPVIFRRGSERYEPPSSGRTTSLSPRSAACTASRI